MRSAFRGPAHQLAVRMRINNAPMAGRPKQPAMHAPSTARVLRVSTLVPFIIIAVVFCLYIHIYMYNNYIHECVYEQFKIEIINFVKTFSQVLNIYNG